MLFSTFLSTNFLPIFHFNSNLPYNSPVSFPFGYHYSLDFLCSLPFILSILIFCPSSDPFELQISAGCTLHAGKACESFLNGAYQGSDFLSFQGSSWKPSPRAGSRAQNVCTVLNHYKDIKEIVQRLLCNTCPQFLAGLFEAGKSELERQGEPNLLFLLFLVFSLLVLTCYFSLSF